MKLIRTPKDWNELTEIIRDMRGSESDLARVAIMAYQLGHRDASTPLALVDRLTPEVS